MAKEHEIGLLDIDVAEAKRRLRQLGATYKGHVKYSRIEFKLGGDLGRVHSWGRVRTDGKSTVITVKKYLGKTKPMEEDEVSTDSFEGAIRIMSKLVKSELFYFETERYKYKLDKADITIDRWPKIPYFMEIEGPSMKYVEDMYRKLGIKGRYVGNVTADGVYKIYGLEYKAVMRKFRPKLKKILDG
jgi:adenylate cyclase class 2